MVSLQGGQGPAAKPEASDDLAERLKSALIEATTSGALRQQLEHLSLEDLTHLAFDWPFWARPDQLPPNVNASGDPWRVWLILGGRGAGKTRAGAEWVRARALGRKLPGETEPRDPARRIALIGETFSEVTRVMVEGASGLLAIHPDEERPLFERTKQQLLWPNGSIAQIFSAEDAESLRGPQFDAAWCDEIAKWRDAEHVWDMLQFALRLGSCPQAVVTTTPKPVPLLKALLADPSAVISRATTAHNAANLAPSFIAEMTRRYAGSSLGRQELLGEIITEHDGSLWRREWIERQRVTAPPEMARIVVALDPPVTSTATSDACGIVVAGMGIDKRAYVLADRTIQGREANVWARAAIALYHDMDADCLVAEVNQGGDLVEQLLKQTDDSVPVKKVRATRGKWLRAEPVAALYAEGRVSHAGLFGDLEDQMCTFSADGLAGCRSPDRLDALVWALTELMLTPRAKPALRQL